MQKYSDDRAERACVPHLLQNPSAPLTDEELKCFAEGASQRLSDALAAAERLAKKKKELRNYAQNLSQGPHRDLLRRQHPELFTATANNLR